jgi:hypothetical protein
MEAETGLDVPYAARALSEELHKMDPPATSGMSVDPLQPDARAALNRLDDALAAFFGGGGGGG